MRLSRPSSLINFGFRVRFRIDSGRSRAILNGVTGLLFSYPLANQQTSKPVTQLRMVSKRPEFIQNHGFVVQKSNSTKTNFILYSFYFLCLLFFLFFIIIIVIFFYLETVTRANKNQTPQRGTSHCL